MWSIGIDPGFVETGVVLIRGREVEDYRTLRCPAGDTALKRAEALATEVMTIIEGWITDHEILKLDVAIETPIYKHNAHSFELQWRLVQEIESMLGVMSLVVDELWLTEVPPATSKKKATGKGGATKLEIAQASPFGWHDSWNDHTWHTLADAWAHSLSTWGECKRCTRINISEWSLPTVKIISGGPDERET